jgi:hypothetical protein
MLLNSCHGGVPKPPGRTGSAGAVGWQVLVFLISSITQFHRSAARNQRAAPFFYQLGDNDEAEKFDLYCVCGFRKWVARMRPKHPSNATSYGS